MTSPRTPTLTPGEGAPESEGEEQATRAARRAFLQELKEDAGSFQLDTLLAEIVKLERVKAVGLPDDVFEGTSEKVVAGWRARAIKMYPSDFGRRRRRSASRCWPRCAMSGRPRSPTVWWSCWSSSGAQDQCAGGAEGRAARSTPSSGGYTARTASWSGSRRGAGAAGGDRPQGAVPGGRRADVGGHRRRGQGEREGVQHPGPDQAARLLLPPLSAWCCPSCCGR